MSKDDVVIQTLTYFFNGKWHMYSCGNLSPEEFAQKIDNGEVELLSE
jgi:hypothetical protein